MIIALVLSKGAGSQRAVSILLGRLEINIDQIVDGND